MVVRATPTVIRVNRSRIKLVIKIVGRTVDNKPVVGGVYQFRATYGAPLDFIFEKLKENGMIPDFWELYNEVPTSKRSELRMAIIDIYGTEYANFMEVTP